MKILKMTKFKSIRSALVLPLIISFFVSTLLITLLIYNNSKNAVEKVLIELCQNMIVLVKNNIDNQLNQTIQLSEIHKDMLEGELLKPNSINERERYFTATLQNFPKVVMTYISLPDGQFYGARRNLDGTMNVVRNNQETNGNSEYYSINQLGEGIKLVQVFKNFDPRKRPWFIKAIETKDINFSSLYSHFVFKEPTITASLPIYKDDILVGVFGVDFLMTWLGDTLSNLPIGEHGQVFIVDEKQQLVATTTGEDIFKILNNQSTNILASKSINPITQKVMSLPKQPLNHSSVSVVIDGSEYLFGVETYKEHGIKWNIYTVIKRNDFLQGMNKTLLNAIRTVVALSIIFIIFAFMLTKKIVGPIVLLNNSAKKLSDGIYEEVPINRHQDELSELTQSFNYMGKQLSEMVNHLEEEVATRTLELEDKNTMLNKLTYIDELSQISNRRRFNEFSNQVIEASSRSNHPIGLMMIDIDFFKNFNDTYGHIDGDYCIKAIGTVLENCVPRSCDLVARYGGEEFVVLLQEPSLEVVRNIAENIRAQIQELNIKHEGSSVGVVTVSIGLVYGTISTNQSVDQVVTQADVALYRAKDNGKNRIEFSELH